MDFLLNYVSRLHRLLLIISTFRYNVGFRICIWYELINLLQKFNNLKTIAFDSNFGINDFYFCIDIEMEVEARVSVRH